MKYFIIIFLLYSTSFAQIMNYQIQNTGKYFNKYFSVSEPSYDQFISKEENEQVSNNKLVIDSSTTFYFQLDLVRSGYNLSDSILEIEVGKFEFINGLYKFEFAIDASPIQTKVGENAFGAKKNYIYLESKVYSFTNLNLNRVMFSGNNESFDVHSIITITKYLEPKDALVIRFSLKLKPKVAKFVSENISAVVGVSFTNYLKRKYDISESDASFDLPIATKREQYNIDAIMREIIFYNTKTKNILCKITITNN